MWTNMEFGWILSWSLDGDFNMGYVKSVCWRARASLESCNSARPLFWAIPTLQTRTQTTTNMCSIVFICFHMFSMLDSYSLWRRPKSVCHQELVARSSPVSNLFHKFHIFLKFHMFTTLLRHAHCMNIFPVSTFFILFHHFSCYYCSSWTSTSKYESNVTYVDMQKGQHKYNQIRFPGLDILNHGLNMVIMCLQGSVLFTDNAMVSMHNLHVS